MTNKEQIQARIARDKAKKAAKRYEKAHGTQAEDCSNLEELTAAVNAQIMALIVPNRLDHAVKDGSQQRAFERYMDDTFAAAHTKDQLKEVGRTILTEAKRIGLRLNPKKTRIVKASKGFKFLQIEYRVTNSGHLVKNLARAGIVRMRRKLKKFRKMVDKGVMTLDHVFESFAAWFGNSFYADSYRTRKRMLTLYHKLFRGYRMEGKFA